MDFDREWKNYIKITGDVEREEKFNKLIENRTFPQNKSFLNTILLYDPNPLIRIKAAGIILDNIGEKFVANLAEIAQTDSMLEGYIGLILLLKPFILKHNLPYDGLKTKPFVFDKLRKIYQANNRVD
ncbi:MAG: hypothetical protein ACW967_05065 [Candidatus Hodarchaeales archaeon]|jgi:hypothetical protein